MNNNIEHCIPQSLFSVAHIFSNAGFCSYIVGGAVRDMLLGKRPTDWDMATDASPEQVTALFKRVIPTGIAHGTVTVIFRSLHIEITTFRTESVYSDGRHPDHIQYASTIEEDLSRRDFTINAMALRLPDTIIDPFGGQEDIKRKIIRTVGSAEERFCEDGLRIMRSLRFSAQLNFVIEENTLRAIPKALSVIAKVAKERFRDEFIKLLCAPSPSSALVLMQQIGIMQTCISELCEKTSAFDKADFLPCDYKSTTVCNLLAARLTLFFRTFYETNDTAKIEKTLKGLRFSNTDIQYTIRLFIYSDYTYEIYWKDSDIRIFLSRLKPEYVDDIFFIYEAQAQQPKEILALFKNRIDDILKTKPPLFIKDLAINGTDLQKEGIPAGKHIGDTLEKLLNFVLEHPDKNTREKLLRQVRQFTTI